MIQKRRTCWKEARLEKCSSVLMLIALWAGGIEDYADDSQVTRRGFSKNKQNKRKQKGGVFSALLPGIQLADKLPALSIVVQGPLGGGLRAVVATVSSSSGPDGESDLH